MCGAILNILFLCLLPAMHENSDCENTSVADDNEDKHDYEYIDEDTIESIRTKFQNQNINNTVTTKANNRYEQSV